MARSRRRVNPKGTLAFGLFAILFIVLLQVLENIGPGTTVPILGSGRSKRIGKNGMSKKERVVRAKETRNITEFAKIIQDQMDETIVFTYASFEYRNTLLNWLVFMRAANVKSIGIVCLDEKLTKYLQKREIPCFSLASEISTGTENEEKASDKKENKKKNQKLSVSAISKLWIVRMAHLVELLKGGFNVVFSDLDAVWLTNAIDSGLLSPRTGDIVISRGKFPFDIGESWGATACMGVGFFRSTPLVIDLIMVAQKEAILASDDQVGLNRALVKAYGLDPEEAFGSSKLKLYSSENAVAVGSNTLPRVVILSHTSIPRFCKEVTKRDWQKEVQIAHCHAHDGAVAKTYKNWGNAGNRNNIMLHYGVWCASAERGSPQGGSSFENWLDDSASKCKFSKKV